MAKKRKTTGVSDLLFGDIDPYGATIGDTVPKTVERVPLALIRPDPEQPRRLLPEDLAVAVDQGELEPVAAVQDWVQRADKGDSMLAHEVRELRRLATAIAQHGLINPITIRPSELGEDRFIIVTGERRYWAHVLLLSEEQQIHEGDTVQSPDQIKATLVPAGVSIRAHQIVENLMREDINVLEKARGLWALRQELSNDAYRRHQQEELGKKKRLVPWKQVEDALDMSRQYRLRIIAVLKLSQEAQQLIDRHNLAEATIRPVVEKLKDYPELQVKALQKLIAWQEAEARGEGEGRRIVPSVKALADRLLAAEEAPTRSRAQATGLDVGKFRQRVRGALRYMQKLDDEALTEFKRVVENDADADLVSELKALRDQIDDMLASVPAENKDAG